MTRVCLSVAIAIALRRTGSASAGLPVPIGLPERVLAPGLTSMPVQPLPVSWMVLRFFRPTRALYWMGLSAPMKSSWPDRSAATAASVALKLCSIRWSNFGAPRMKLLLASNFAYCSGL